MKNEIKSQRNSYSCDKCMDTGWMLIPQEKMAPLAVSCECRELEKVKNQWIAAGINPNKSRETFKNFQIWNEESRIAKNTAIAYYKDFDSICNNRKNSILLCGQVGGGKSHLSIALALNFIQKKIKVVYMPYRDVITSIKQNMLDDEFYKKTLSKYQSCQVLLIDDLFKGKITQSDINIIFGATCCYLKRIA